MRRSTAGFYGVTGGAVLTAAVLTLTAPLAAELRTVVVPQIAMLVADVLAVTFAVRAARRPGPDAATRRAWWILAAAFTALCVASVLFAAFPGARSFPVPGHWARLGVFLPLMLAGLLSMPRRPAGQLAHWKTPLDVGAVVIGGAMLMWYLVTGPALAAGAALGPHTVAFAIAYPIGDLVLLFGVTLVLIRGVDASARLPMTLLGAALIFEIVGNTYLGFLAVHPGGPAVVGWQFWCWMVAHALVATAAFEASRIEGASRVRVPGSLSVSRLPYLGIAAGLSLLVAATLREERIYPWTGLVLGALLLVGIVVLRQVATLRENHELAITDGLTGLANRARLHDALGRALARGRRSGHSTAVLLADLNGFKQVNDGLGHAAGDRLLVEFAGMLRRAVLGSDVVGRLGGDEFAVVLHDIGPAENAQAVVRRLRQEMEMPILIGDVVVQVRAAIGVAVTGPGEHDADALLRMADEAMYRAKRAEKDGLDPHAEELAAELGDAVRAGQLRVHYQPIATLPDGRIVGVEALVRWAHPVRGEVPPLSFIPLAEETGAIREIGAWVLEQACRQVAAWHAAGHSLHLAVNVSPRQLVPGLAERVFAVLDDSGLPYRDLIVEVTESVRVEDPVAVEELRKLHKRGIRIALDDFGTGYSTLRYLTALPVDILKIDRSFVAKLDGTPEGAAVAETVLRLSQMMHLETVAEGVESPGQAAELAGLGCVNAQGYHFARPMAADEVSDLLTEQNPASV
ncbi:putative bifunctional diguanylate cyclase/phosphodiesterase [Catenuloplanes atrovinosus]|uniref:Diguanylate cyclase (GGDEF)-like protein n=1 Tax=Catenuloplanes atrovinosus TaxID=137266 RepID=A0AAE4C7H8_9ACTN|nr:bifunctional diguanylate cyclase/phosphodiesterase [Catenuloplanes atrovinosus]MDR7273898.1 diguanylate cyclase (GGDEF)-like protein [Catenuloplanes atrovinosus]